MPVARSNGCTCTIMRPLRWWTLLVMMTMLMAPTPSSGSDMQGFFCGSQGSCCGISWISSGPYQIVYVQGSHAECSENVSAMLAFVNLTGGFVCMAENVNLNPPVWEIGVTFGENETPAPMIDRLNDLLGGTTFAYNTDAGNIISYDVYKCNDKATELNRAISAPCDWETQYHPIDDTVNSSTCKYLSNCTLGVTYQVASPASYSNRVCRNTTKCRMGITYETTAPTLLTDRMCSSVSSCGPLFYASVDATLLTDTKCSLCTLPSACPSDEIVVSKCTLNSNLECGMPTSLATLQSRVQSTSSPNTTFANTKTKNRDNNSSPLVYSLVSIGLLFVLVLSVFCILRACKKYKEGQLDKQVAKMKEDRDLEMATFGDDNTRYAEALAKATNVVMKDMAMYNNLWSKLNSNCKTVDELMKFETVVNEQAVAIEKCASNPAKSNGPKLLQPDINGLIGAEYILVLRTRFDGITAEVDQALQNICATVRGGVLLVSGPNKKDERIYEKAKMYQDSGGIRRVTDFVRRSLIVDAFGKMRKLLPLLSAKFEVMRIKNRFGSEFKSATESAGYRDCQVVLRVKGLIFELQLHLTPFYNLKTKIATSKGASGRSGHERYIIFRNAKESAMLAYRSSSISNEANDGTLADPKQHQSANVVHVEPFKVQVDASWKSVKGDELMAPLLPIDEAQM